ncbi:MAG: hypothetical protein CMQ05_01275 [Gammaproteobacteria bacterium]|nr:hypothetical protein [Gammaproteobacteria bacterium]RPG25716.1 MAG: hypothetical protein CBC10_007235 [Gammaproteobacteria bacterium TMED50]|tara:strand:+ start:5072 stop:5782 length:711 start_codon:yes stop_codon:yes gene_type:complete
MASRSDIGTSAPTTDRPAFLRQGYTIIPGLMSDELLMQARESCEPWLMAFDARSIDGGTVRSRYRKGLLAVTRLFDDLYMHPLLLDLATRVFKQEGYILGGASIRNVAPREAARAMHMDDVIFAEEQPRNNPCMINVLIALDDFTAETGATHVVPRSHLWDREIDQRCAYMTADMRPGSAIVLHGRVWHRNGDNTSDQERKALSFTYRTRKLRKAGSSDVVEGLPEKLERIVQGVA